MKTRKSPASTRPARLLHFVPHYSTGGVELASESGARKSGGILRTHFLSTPYQVKRAPCEWITAAPNRSSFSPGAVLAAVREVRRQKPDVVLFSLWRSMFVFLAVRVLFPRTPVIMFIHNTKNNHSVNAVFTWIMVRLADAVWADSAATALSSRAGGRRARPISMLLQRTDALPRAAHAARPSFVCWCRLNPQKRVHLAIDLIGRLKRLGRDDLRFTVIGQDDGCLADLQAQVESLGLTENVEFLGRRDRAFIAKAAREATFYLQLSAFEGQGMAVMEAMQLGLVPVVCPVGAIADYCEDGVNGIFYSDGEATAGRLHELLGNPEQVAKLSAAAQTVFSMTKEYAEDAVEAFGDFLTDLRGRPPTLARQD